MLSPERSSTQTHSVPSLVPPGLSSAQDFPPLAAPSQPLVTTAPINQRKVTTRAATSAIKPITPILPGPSAPKAATNIGQRSNDQTSFKGEKQDAPGVNSPESSTEFSVPRSLSKREGKGLEDNSTDVSISANLRQDLGSNQRFEERGRPGKLNLEDAREVSKFEEEITAAEHAPSEVAANSNTAQATPSQPTTPATAPSYPSAPSSIRNNQPKVIRLTGTSKTEIPSPGTAPSQGSWQTSRRQSLTSLNRPESPTSERISDTVSYTSASMSRANSPPSSKIGSASARRVTKNQQKKERQERARKAEGEAVKKEDSAPKVEETIIQAPILGRKKKTKKPKERTEATADSTPAVTRPTSPEPQESAIRDEMPPPISIEPAKSTKENKKQTKSIPVAPEEPDLDKPTPGGPAVVESNRGNPAQLTSAEIFANLQASDELPQNAIETLFKPVTSASHRFDHNLDPELILSGHHSAIEQDQLDQLAKNEPVVVVLDKNNALIVFPNRRCLKGLVPSQANRYKELYLQGHRVNMPPLNTEGLDAVDRLMPTYQSWGEHHAPAVASAPSQPEPISTAQLTNRFATHVTPQAPPPAPMSVGSDGLAPRSLLSRGTGHDLLMYQVEKRVMETEEAEAALAVERKNTEGLEKRLNALIRKNRRLVLGSGN